MPPQLRMGLSVAVGVSLQWHRWCPGHIASCLKQGWVELIKNLSNFKPVFRFWYWNVTQHIVIQIWKSTLDIYFSSFNQPMELNKWLQCLLNSAKVGFQILSEAELSGTIRCWQLYVICQMFSNTDGHTLNLAICWLHMLKMQVLKLNIKHLLDACTCHKNQ